MSWAPASAVILLSHVKPAESPDERGHRTVSRLVVSQWIDDTEASEAPKAPIM
jgi:hypothetical protein